MSSSITIPTSSSSANAHGHGQLRNGHQPHHRHHLRSMDATIGSPATSSAMTPSSSAASSSSASPSTSSSLCSSATPSRIPKAKAKAKGKAVDTLSQSAPAPVPTRMEHKMAHNRRPSLLGSAISQQEEARVINIGDPDGPPRLISYLASSQGFMWNPEIFVPSYVDFEYTPLENRREPIHEIFVSDEEMDQMLPK